MSAHLAIKGVVSGQSAADAFCADMLARIGFAPSEIIGDGKIRRFATSASKRDDAGWYQFHNDDFPAGSFGDWRINEKFKWRARETTELSPQERERLKELKVERQKKIEAGYAAAAGTSRLQWSNAKPASDDHDYLKKKGVAAHGLRAAYGRLLVPASDDDAIISLQSIGADGKKLFTDGGRVAGGYHLIGEIGDTVVIGEGYATCATIHEATGLAVLVAFNNGNMLAVAPKIRAKHPKASIIIAADDDHKTERERGFNPGIRDARKAADAVNGVVAVPPFDRKAGDAGTDWNDYAATKGKEAVAAAFKAIIDNAEITRLALMKALDYDRERAKIAETLGVRTSTLDAQVKAKREEVAAKKVVGLVSEIEPWAESVNVADLLVDTRSLIRRFIICDSATATATALWIAFTHCIEHVHVAPIALITAPGKRCGKTQLLDVIGRLSRRSIFTSNLSSGVVYRMIEASSPTLMIDEADSFLKENEELRGIINSGHTRTTAFVIRCVGEDFEPKRFSTWGAKAIAGIGRLSDTINDRSIILELRRKLQSEKVDRLRHADPKVFEELARKLARFGADHGHVIGLARPHLPDSINERAQDNWEPLLAIADLAGGHWPKEARRAALELSGEKPDNKSTAEELLSDIREIFAADGAERIAHAELLKKLIEDDLAPWATWNRGKPMTPRQLGSRLAEFKIESRTVYIGRFDKPKGFHKDQFADAWSRYLDGRDEGTVQTGDTPLPDTPLPSVTRSPPNESGGFGVTKGVTEKNAVSHPAVQTPGEETVTDGEGDQAAKIQSPVQSPQNPKVSRQGDRVTDQTPPPAKEHGVAGADIMEDEL